MTQEEKELYKKQMKEKAIAYAKEKLGGDDAKMFLKDDEYQEMVIEIANNFLAGVDASIKWLQEYSKSLEK